MQIYRMGQRFGVIPHGVALDLWLRAHREHPAIVDAESRKDARETAYKLRALTPATVQCVPAEMSTPNGQGDGDGIGFTSHSTDP